jgi:hypothetical protein
MEPAGALYNTRIYSLADTRSFVNNPPTLINASERLLRSPLRSVLPSFPCALCRSEPHHHWWIPRRSFRASGEASELQAKLPSFGRSFRASGEASELRAQRLFLPHAPASLFLGWLYIAKMLYYGFKTARRIFQFHAPASWVVFF